MTAPLLITRRLLAFNPIRYCPWLTERVVEQELAIDQYREDEIREFKDSTFDTATHEPTGEAL